MTMTDTYTIYLMNNIFKNIDTIFLVNHCFQKCNYYVNLYCTDIGVIFTKKLACTFCQSITFIFTSNHNSHQ